MRKETERQIFHLLLGTLLAALVLLMGKFYSLTFFGCSLVFGVFLSEFLRRGYKVQPFHWFIARMEREKVRPGRGTLNFFTGTFIALVFFDVRIVFASILILSFGDAFSTIVGKGFGRARLRNGKTVEGFLAGFLASLIVVLPYLSIYIAVAACLAASLTELLSPVDDNIVIPPLTSLIIYMLGI